MKITPMEMCFVIISYLVLVFIFILIKHVVICNYIHIYSD